MSDTPLIPAAVYGLRTWGLAADAGGDVLAAVHRRTPWPAGGEWLRAECTVEGHDAPAAHCNCGIHAWHPRRASARRVLASRFEVPGVVEAAGPIEIHEDGFRAQRGRPYALVALPGRNAALIRRVAERHRAQVVEIRGPDELLAWCRERGLGLDEEVVERLLGPAEIARGHQARRRRKRRNAARVVAAVAVSAALVVAGGELAQDDPGPHDVFGRTGKVHVP